MSPIQIVLGRLAAAVMIAVVAYRKECLARCLVPWAHLAVMAMMTNIAPYFLFTLLLAVSTHTERLTAPRLAGLTLGFVGVVILAAPWHDGALHSSLLGIGAACSPPPATPPPTSTPAASSATAPYHP